MKRILMMCLCTAATLSLVSCGSSPQAKGDKAYEQAQQASGDQRRHLEKEAYMNYREAVLAAPDKASPKTRERFLEMAINRVNLILSEGGYRYEAVPLIEEEIEKVWSPQVGETVKNAYAEYLVLLADSSMENKHILEGIEKLDRAVEVAADKAKFEKAREERVGSLVEQYFAMAKAEYDQGRDTKDPESMVRAEFYAKMVLYFDSTHQKAQKLLAAARRRNVDTYSVYKKVIDPPPDTALFDTINKYDIMLAIPVRRSRGRSYLMKVNMWNYSYNPQRLKARSFYLVDTRGRKYTALRSSKISPEFLDQEHETQLTLYFPKPRGKLEKLVYENKEHYAEKRFF